MKATASWRAASASDPGRQRHVNEDRVYIDEELGILLVADGLGGHAAGEHAADIAVREIAARLNPRESRDLERELRLAIAAANNRIYQAAQANPEWHGMACVLTLAVVQDDQVTVGHVGDSRLYIFKDRVLRKLTSDHSPIGELEDQGELTEQQAMRHPRRNEIFRDVGSVPRNPEDDGFIDTQTFLFPHDAALLLCSDGLTDVVTSAAITAILENFNGEPRRSAQQLIEAANQAGGKDNISVILVAGPEFVGRQNTSTAPAHARHEITRMRDTRRAWPNWLKNILWLILGLLLGASLAFAFAWWQRAAWTPKAPPPPAPQRVAVDPADSLAIIKALSAAAPGDTITVPKGQYLGPLVLKEDVNVEALEPGQAVVRSDPNSASYSGVAIVASGIQHAVIHGLAISGDDSHPLRVGLLIQNASVEADELDISGAIEAGIEVAGNSHPLLLANFVHANSGPGVIIRDQSGPRLAGNTISGNGASPDASKPGLDISPTAEPVLTNNNVSDNGTDLKQVHGFKSRVKSKPGEPLEPRRQ
jgi:parallel beta-helix repeat protein